ADDHGQWRPRPRGGHARGLPAGDEAPLLGHDQATDRPQRGRIPLPGPRGTGHHDRDLLRRRPAGGLRSGRDHAAGATGPRVTRDPGHTGTPSNGPRALYRERGRSAARSSAAVAPFAGVPASRVPFAGLPASPATPSSGTADVPANS